MCVCVVLVILLFLTVLVLFCNFAVLVFFYNYYLLLIVNIKLTFISSNKISIYLNILFFILVNYKNQVENNMIYVGHKINTSRSTWTRPPALLSSFNAPHLPSSFFSLVAFSLVYPHLILHFPESPLSPCALFSLITENVLSMTHFKEHFPVFPPSDWINAEDLGVTGQSLRGCVWHDWLLMQCYNWCVHISLRD